MIAFATTSKQGLNRSTPLTFELRDHIKAGLNESARKLGRRLCIRWVVLTCTVHRMCNSYTTPTEDDIERYWRIDRRSPGWWKDVPTGVYPRAPGLFIRRALDEPGHAREAVAGQWGLIPCFAKTRALKYSTNNARAEELSGKASYKEPWKRGQRCIIPALSFDEPNWETQALLRLTPVEVFEAGPVGKPGYRLSDLIAQCDLDQAPPRDMRDWDMAPPMGGELL